MDLRERISEIHQDFISGNFIASDLIIDECETICDEFAIGFAEWIIDTDKKPIGEFTIKELLQIYKDEKSI